MKQRLIGLYTLLLLSACATTPVENIVQTAIAGTQTALVPLPPPAIYNFTPFPTNANDPMTGGIVDPTSTLIVSQNPFSQQQGINCGEAFIARLVQPTEFTRDLFEHHANGTFLIVFLEMENITDQPIQIWDGDYFLKGIVGGKAILLSPHKAATGYLFVTRGYDLHQDKIYPGKRWRTYLAFDVDLRGSDWTLIVKPGKEGGNQICEVQIDLTE